MAGETGHPPGPCRIYGGTLNADGYGVLPKPVYGSRLAHRAALAEHLGRPVRGVTRHRCHVRACTEPRHLTEGSQAQNIADTVAAGNAAGRFTEVPECIHGHVLAGSNLRVKHYRDGRVERACLTCMRRRNGELAQRRKAARHARSM